MIDNTFLSLAGPVAADCCDLKAKDDSGNKTDRGKLRFKFKFCDKLLTDFCQMKSSVNIVDSTRSKISQLIEIEGSASKLYG